MQLCVFYAMNRYFNLIRLKSLSIFCIQHNIDTPPIVMRGIPYFHRRITHIQKRTLNIPCPIFRMGFSNFSILFATDSNLVTGEHSSS